MSDIQTRGGFVGDPAAAGSGGCCGNPPQATDILLPDPADATAAPCCGTQAEAQAAGACCGTTARADAVASSAGCCG
jgi:hypothetical protein